MMSQPDVFSKLPWNRGYYPLRKAVLRLSKKQKEFLLQQSSITEYGMPVLKAPWRGKYRYGVFLVLMSQHKDAKSVTRLDLRGCELNVLPCEIAGFVSLQILLLCSNGLKSLPYRIGTLPLQTLSLGKNKISKIPISIKKCRKTLHFFTLGENQICGEYPFLATKLYALQRGSIGNSVISEPIGQNWMLRKDAILAVQRLQEWLTACAVSYQKEWLKQALELWYQFDEPMIDEQMYRDCYIKDHVLYTPYLGEKNTWIRFALRKRLTHINEGAVVHSSLWNKNLDVRWYTKPTAKDWKLQEDLSIKSK